MKKILAENLRTNLKRYVSKSHFSTSRQHLNSVNVENEIRDSYNKLANKFEIDFSSYKSPKFVQHETNNISMRDIEAKYINNKSNSDIDKIIKKLHSENIGNIKGDKEHEDLLLFIKNCKKYNYNEYLKDSTYFQNKEIRNFMTNTDLLESLKYEKNPFTLDQAYQAKMRVQNLYKLRKGEKGETLDHNMNTQFENEKYDYMNFLAETRLFNKLQDFTTNAEHNVPLINSIKAGSNLVEDGVEHLNKATVQNHYIDYLKQKKRDERKESLGLSQLEESIYDRFLDNQKAILTADGPSYIPSKEQSGNDENKDKPSEDDAVIKEGFSASNGKRFAQTTSTSIKGSAPTPWPYQNKDDYEIADLLDNNSYHPDKIIGWETLRELDEYDPLLPDLTDNFQNMQGQAHLWSFFIMVPQIKVYQAKMYNEFIQIMKNAGNQPDKIYPNLINYYHLLPTWAKDHPSLQMVVRGLEFYQPYTKFSEKVVLVNCAINYIMPLDTQLKKFTRSLMDGRKPQITLANIEKLIAFDCSETRKYTETPDDFWTDEEELFASLGRNAADVRAEEKAEEEERKLKKKEEGRAKRAAEEAKASGASLKVDKAAEDKKKREEEEKRNADEEEELRQMAQDQKKEKKEKGKVKDKNKDKEKSKTKNKQKEQEEKEKKMEMEVVITANDSKYIDPDVEKAEKARAKDKNRSNKFSGNLNEDIDELDSKDKMRKMEDLGDRGQNRRREVSSEKMQLRELQKERERERAVVANQNQEEYNKQKETQHLIETVELGDKPQSSQQDEIKPTVFGNSGQAITSPRASEVQQLFSFLKSSESSLEEKLQKIKNDLVHSDPKLLKILYVSLMRSDGFVHDEKELTQKVFDFKESVEELNNLVVKEKEVIDNRMAGIEILLQNKQKPIKEISTLSIQEMYKESLREDDIETKMNDDVGLRDVYYKPPVDPTVRLRTKEHDIPIDYFLNDDGFWDDYIAQRQNTADIREFHIKPFTLKKTFIKKRDQA